MAYDEARETTALPALDELVTRLVAILTAILSSTPDGGPPGEARGADDLAKEFGALGLNSVDYLEFVINVESSLNVDIPDEALMDPSLCSIQSWGAYLHKNLAALSTAAVRGPTAVAPLGEIAPPTGG